MSETGTELDICRFLTFPWAKVRNRKKASIRNRGDAYFGRILRRARSAVSVKGTSQKPRRLERQDRTHYHSTIIYGRIQIAAINTACIDVPIMDRRFIPRRCPDIIIRCECMFILIGNLGHPFIQCGRDIALT